MLVSSRFCGPPDSGNGGYVAGLVAEYVDGDAEVKLIETVRGVGYRIKAGGQ